MLVEALKLQISDSEWNVRKIEPLRKPSQMPFCFVTILLLSLSCSLGVIEKLGMGVVPYVVLLVVPVLGRMSDQCEDVRLMATYCFATLIRFMPLEVRSHGSVGNFRTSICDIWRHSVTCLNEYNKFDYKRCFNKQTKKSLTRFQNWWKGKNRFEGKWQSLFFVRAQNFHNVQNVMRKVILRFLSVLTF